MELDNFIADLLHINDVENNSLLHIGAKPSKTYMLSHPDYVDFGEHLINMARKPGASAALTGSAIGHEQIMGQVSNSLAWTCVDGTHDPKQLDKMITSVYKAIAQKGTNPLFLGIGAIKWVLAGKKGAPITAETPLLVYPIRLVRSVKVAPVKIEFIADDVYLNPCFVAMLAKVFPAVAQRFPHPSGASDLDDPVDLTKLGDGKAYFDTVKKFVAGAVGSSGTVFEFDGNTAVIAPYEHNELCMYYDIRRRRPTIDAHPLIGRIFNKQEKYTVPDINVEPQFIRARDTSQERIVRRVVGGESLIVKGPPGTGKTHTIINIIAALMAAGKKVLLSSAKLSALSEVYQQMPDELRDYCMLLECETEADAAEFNPSKVKDGLRRLVEKRKAAGPLPPSVRENIQNARAEKTAAARTLTEYLRETFEDRSILGLSYYEALDELCSAPEAVEFALGSSIMKLTPEQLADLTFRASKAGDALKKATDGGKIPFEKCPWAPVMEAEALVRFIAADKEKAIKTFAEFRDDIGEIGEALKKAEDASGIGGLKLSYAPALSSVRFDENIALKILEMLSGNESVAMALMQYSMCENAEYFNEKFDASKHAEFTYAEHKDKDLTVESARKIAASAALLERVRDEDGVKRISSYIESVDKLYAQMGDYEKTVARVFNFSDLTEADKVKIDKLVQKFDGLETAPTKPSFATNGAYKKLAKFSFLPDIEFVEVASAAIARLNILALQDGVLCAKKEISRIYGKMISDSDLEAVRAVCNRCAATGMKYADYLKWFASVEKEFLACSDGLNANGDATVGVIAASVQKALVRDGLVKALSSLDGAVDLSGENAPRVATLAVALSDLKKQCGDTADKAIAQKAVAIAGEIKDVSDKAEKLIASLKTFGSTVFPNYYTRNAEELTAENLDNFVKLCADRDMLGSAMQFCETFGVEQKGISLARFFVPFMRLERAFDNGTDFGALFRISALSAATDFYTQTLGDRKNGAGRRVADALDSWASAEARENDATVKKIALDCLMKIDPQDRDFDFLGADKGFDNTLRRLFKIRAREILKLKKCFLLSASTASVLFGSEEYNNFDVVIVDEASQLEPVCALPVISRSKQCVLVGDEMQMPPIHHFGGREEKTQEDEYGEIIKLDGDSSVLSLALANEAFPVEALTCHFRSRTEALIAFSQERYYPYMRTFPSAVPRADGLGFKDILVSDGYCDGGVNSAEARAVVEELKAHFDAYYKGGKLAESVGVVAFGLQQINAIQSLVRADKELTAKIEKAIASFPDLEEKLIFFKTIETVQGQEADHLILSVTYGKNKEGKIVQSYGELNRGNLGQRIFNVAVTRARSSVTVIHSVEHYEIKGESVSYIGEYIKLAESFARAEESVFSRSTGEKKHGFFTDVKKCLNSFGIEDKRIVFDCGVTEGSVRIPIAVLSPDLKSAELGIWCERPPRANEPYIDENSRYYRILENRGWKMHRMCIRDFVYNAAAEVNRLRDKVKECVTLSLENW